MVIMTKCIALREDKKTKPWAVTHLVNDRQTDRTHQAEDRSMETDNQ